MHALSAKADIQKFDFKHTGRMFRISDKFRDSLANLLENFGFIDRPMRTEGGIGLIPAGNLFPE